MSAITAGDWSITKWKGRESKYPQMPNPKTTWRKSPTDCLKMIPSVWNCIRVDCHTWIGMINDGINDRYFQGPEASSQGGGSFILLPFAHL